LQHFPEPQILRSMMTSKKFVESEAYLRRERIPRLPNGQSADSTFELWEHFLAEIPEKPSPSFIAEVDKVRALFHHIDQVTDTIRASLWSRQFYISNELIGEMLFSSLSTEDPVLQVLELLRANEQVNRAVLVFPLRSFGIRGAGIARLAELAVSAIDVRRGYAIAPQTNDLQRTLEFVNHSARRLGVNANATFEDLDHVRRSRGARWLERNPLLMVGLNSSSGYYFENEFLQLGRLRVVAGALVMISRFEPFAKNSAESLFSSRNINNFQTLDTNHYLMLSKRQHYGKSMEVQAIPVHSRKHILELSDLNIEFGVEENDDRSKLVRQVFTAVNTVFDKFVAEGFGVDGRRRSRAQTFAKWLESLAYFRRSVRDEGSWEAIVGLATAFELLLIDGYAPGTADLLYGRALRLMRGQQDRVLLAESIRRLYHARNKAVHSGELNASSVATAQKAYVRCFIAMARRADSVPLKGGGPAKLLTGI